MGDNLLDVNATTVAFQDDDYMYPTKIPHIRAIINTCYYLVFLCCIVGNLLVILVVLMHRKMRSITNFFLANLALADFLVGVFCVLPTMDMMNFRPWKLGNAMCKIQFFVQCVSYNASIVILTAIAIERYFAIIYPIRSRQMTTLCLLRGVVIAIWIFSALTGVPLLFFYGTKDYFADDGGVESYCEMQVGMQPYVRAYMTATFILLFVLPLMLMSVIYIRISIALWKTTKQDGLRRNTVRGTSVTQNSSANAQAFQKPAKDKTAGHLDDTHLQNGASSPDEPPRKGDTHEKHSSAPQTGGEEGQTLAGEDDEADDLLEAEDYENDWPTDQRSPPGIKLYQMKVEEGNVKPVSSLANRVPIPRARTQKVQQNAVTARRKIVRMLVAVLLAFTLCVLPYHIYFMRLYWGPPPKRAFSIYLIAALIPLIYFLQSGLNPILYAFLSENFRGSFYDVVCCRHRRHRCSVRSTNLSLETANTTV